MGLEVSQKDLVHVYPKAIQRFTFVIDINSYQQDMFLSEPLFNANGAVIIFENSTLSPKLIERLKENGITKISVYKTTNSPIMNDPETFEDKYLGTLFMLKECMKDIFIRGKVDAIKINLVAEHIIEIGCNNRFILKNEVIDSLDEYLYTHSINVGILSMLIGKWLKFDDVSIRELIQAAILHDIGKCKVDQNILNKKGPLLPGEYDILKEHAVFGLEILKDIIPNKDICMGVYMHHERCDGSGYPKGLNSDKIHEYARIIAVADVYDAMTSNRVYRRKQSPFDVFEHIEKGSMTGFDIRVTLTFLKNVANYFLGDAFYLNNGELCKVVYNNPTEISRPLIKIGEKYIDLSKNKELKITAIA